MGKRIPKPELQTGLMKPAEVTAYRKWFGGNMKVLGSMLGGIGPRTIGRWERGEAIVPNDLADKMRSLVFPRDGQEKALSVNDDRPAPAAPARTNGKRRCIYTVEIKIYEEACDATFQSRS